MARVVSAMYMRNVEGLHFLVEHIIPIIARIKRVLSNLCALDSLCRGPGQHFGYNRTAILRHERWKGQILVQDPLVHLDDVFVIEGRQPCNHFKQECAYGGGSAFTAFSTPHKGFSQTVLPT